MEALQTLKMSPVYRDGLQHLPFSLQRAQTFSEAVLTCPEDVIITSEFQRRPTKGENPALELAALKHLTSFLTAEPSVVLHELATILVQICNAGSAGVTLQERRHSTETLQCAAEAGQLASKTHLWVPKDSPSGTVIDRQRAEVFHRPERFYTSLRHNTLTFYELLVVPWELSSGRRGAIWVAIHEAHRHLNPEDLHLVTMVANFARHALQRSLSQETRRSCETLAAAARVANQLAHEVNNPLQALINSLYLVSPALPDPHLFEARAQADRLAELVRSVLEVKRQDGSA